MTAAANDTIVDIQSSPSSIELRGPQSSYTILVEGRTITGNVVDLTSEAQFRSAASQVATVSNAGFVRAIADGASEIVVEAAGKTLHVPVKVQGSAEPRRFNFENDIVSLFSKFGCNSSGCHGKAEGQNGFKLSVFGFDPAADYAAIIKEARGRRVFPSAPESSLLLAKVCGAVVHGGGVRIPRASSEYETIRAWIAAGLPFGGASDPHVTAIRIEPQERVLAMHGKQQLRVIATFSDGRAADVTAHAKYQTNQDDLASVNATGLVTASDVPGEVAIMASYLNAIDVFRAVVPRGEKRGKFPQLAVHNFVDPIVFRKLEKLNIEPSELASDAEFLRRVNLDIIGTLPTSDEARRFLNDQRPERRIKLVDELLERPEFADYWALKWADLLHVDRQALGHKYAYRYYQWIRDSLAGNKPLDRFARELLTAEGPLKEVGAANFYKVVTKPGEEASALSQVLLGVRIACAQCHHHPFDRWSQTDYFGMQAFFTALSIEKSPAGELLSAGSDTPTKHPRTGETINAHALGTTMPAASPRGDRRQQLADWLTAPENPWFARNLANRVWGHFLGRGLVEPIDDVRATNPPTNPELLDALAKHLVDSRFDLKQLIRAITASRVYQTSSRPNATNERDEQNYSRALFKRIDAEVMLDMVCQTTGVPERFTGMPAGTRAIQLWDSKVPHYFLKLFGRPLRVTACECERNTEPGVAQILHIMNSPEIQAKLNHDGGYLARLVRQKADDSAIIDDLYLTFYSRFPTTVERERALEHLGKEANQRRQAVEDLAWSMLNTLEFVFNH